ncbi:MAG: nucleotide pyrophosphohydrolase [Armatimonadetes bacterium]|nr:nucleotide pyrophosphohydrolase [Armatimonadota bacterium]
MEPSPAATDSTPLTLSGFQQFIRERYHDRDAARGTPATFMWLVEEIGELASALQGGQEPGEEFADVLGWLATLANMHGVDLEAAVRAKYFARNDPAHK